VSSSGQGDSKLAALKKVASKKKAVAAELDKEMAAEQKAQADDKQRKAATDAGEEGTKSEEPAEVSKEANNPLIEADEDIGKDAVSQENVIQAKADDAKRVARNKRNEKSAKSKAKSLTKKAFELKQKYNEEASTVTLAEDRAKLAPAGFRRTDLLSSVKKERKKARKLKMTVAYAQKDAALATDRADPKNFDFRENILYAAKEARMKNEVLLKKETSLFHDEKVKQATLVHEKVEADEKIQLAKSTRSHAEATNEKSLVEKSQKLVDVAKMHAGNVSDAILASAKSLQETAIKIQEAAKKQSAAVSEDFKKKIHDAIAHARKVRKKTQAIILAHKVDYRAAVASSKREGLIASASKGAAEKAQRKSAMMNQKAAALEDRANHVASLMEPLEFKVDKGKKAVRMAEDDVRIAQQSGSKTASIVSDQKFMEAKHTLQQVREQIRGLGKLPSQLRAEAEELRDKATHEEDIERKADKSAGQYQQEQETALARAADAHKKIEDVTEVFLPQVLRHTHREVGYIEHELAKQLSALKKLGVIKPSDNAEQQAKAEADRLEKDIVAQNAASRVKLVGLKQLREKVKLMRSKAEEALVQASNVEKKTKAADDKIMALKKQACTKATQLQARLAKGKTNGEDMEQLEAETSRAQKACQKAGETLVSARGELNKRAQEVSTAAENAKQLEAKYADKDEKLAAKEAEDASKASIEEKEHEEGDSEEMSALKALEKQAQGKKAEADLMLRAAEKTGDGEAKEIAKAAVAAAADQLAKLKIQKTAMAHQIKADKSKLGELHSSIRSDVLEIKHEEANDEEMQDELGSEQSSAAEEAAATRMESKLNKVTLKLRKEERAKDLMESAKEEQDVNVRAEMEKMKSKLDAIDAATAAVISDLDDAINKGQGDALTAEQKKAEAGNVKKDVAVANDQIGKLDGLKKAAHDKVKKAEAELAAAKKQGSNGTDATQAATEKLEQARKDLVSVTEATKKVADRKNKDEAKLKEDKAVIKKATSGSTATDQAIGVFAKKLKDKFAQLQKSTEEAAQRDASIERENWSSEASSNASSTKALEDRIAALEAAVEAAGGNAQQIENRGEGMGNTTSKAAVTQQITDEKQKLQEVESKISVLDEEFSKAAQSNDTHAQITVGTEQKDLEHEAKNINATLQDLYQKLEGRADITSADPNFAMMPNGEPANITATSSAEAAAVSAETNATSVKADEVAHTQTALKDALAKAKDASAKRQKLADKEHDAQEALKSAMQEEQSSLATAKEAKQSLSQKMDDLTKEEEKEKKVVEEAKSKLTKMASDLQVQESTAQKKQEDANAKMQQAKATLQDVSAEQLPGQA